MASDIITNVNIIYNNKNNNCLDKPPLEIINEDLKEKSFTLNENKYSQDNINQYESQPDNNINQDILNTNNNEAVKPEEHNFFVKINNEIISITTIIPEHKLLNATEEDVMFQSNVKRLLNQKVGNHLSQTFCDRFCVVTVNLVRLYKSKEQFLTMAKPTNIFPLNGIKSVKRFYLKGNKKLHFFVIELNDWNNRTGKQMSKLDITDSSVKKHKKISPINTENDQNNSKIIESNILVPQIIFIRMMSLS